MKVVRQLKGIDSNKLQPIIRYHNDKDFKVSSCSIEPLNYQEILFKPKFRKRQTSQLWEVNESQLTENNYDIDGSASIPDNKTKKQQTLKDSLNKTNKSLENEQTMAVQRK